MYTITHTSKREKCTVTPQKQLLNTGEDSKTVNSTVNDMHVVIKITATAETRLVQTIPIETLHHALHTLRLHTTHTTHHHTTSHHTTPHHTPHTTHHSDCTYKESLPLISTMLA